ncbi:MAG: cell division protein FtsA [Bacteroidales bacterium]|nr:cell division protein FtsA [Bacteroidales bacterium]MBQ5424594.1 cell division protein FtsA [Bacteroidales bacterium]MBR3798866.1 cell division protein FtsA [Bacteroidales bacterium]
MDDTKKIIAAIDIGTTKIATVAACENSGKFDILGFGTAQSNGIKHGVVRNIEDTVKAITESLNQLGKDYNADFPKVYVGIAGQYVKTTDNTCRVLVNGIVTERHLEELKAMAMNVVRPGSETIDVILLSYSINGTVVDNPLGKQCEYLYGNFHVITGQTMMVNNIKKCVVQAGLDVRTVFLEPLASAEAVLTDDEKRRGVALIDIGGGTSDLAVYKDGEVIHTAVIPIGGATVTGDIKDKFGITYEQAESMKCLYGSAVHVSGSDVSIEVKTAKVNSNIYVSRNEMSEVIQARMEEILNAVKFQLETVYADKVPAGVVITGGGSLVANLNQLASFILKNSIRLACPISNIEGKFADSLKKPQYSTVVGLVKKGFDFEQGLRKKELVEQKPEPKPEPVPEPQPEPISEPEKKEPEKKPEKPKRRFGDMFRNLMDKIDEDE